MAHTVKKPTIYLGDLLHRGSVFFEWTNGAKFEIRASRAGTGIIVREINVARLVVVPEATNVVGIRAVASDGKLL